MLDERVADPEVEIVPCFVSKKKCPDPLEKRGRVPYTLNEHPSLLYEAYRGPPRLRPAPTGSIPGMSIEASPPSERTQVRRLPERGRYDRETVYSILDEGLFCHVAYIVDGRPSVIPTIHARVGDTLYFHGSQASRTLRSLRDGAEVCVAVTILDGLVVARSGFHSSMNYRSVVVFGHAREVTDPDEKLAAQDALVEHVIPGRSADVRPPTEAELKQTMLVAIPLDESSAKVRTGPPKDDSEDYELPIWAGVLPLKLEPQPPIADPRLLPGLETPENLRRYRRPI